MRGMDCPACGAPADPTDPFCPGCGLRADERDLPPPPPAADAPAPANTTAPATTTAPAGMGGARSTPPGGDARSTPGTPPLQGALDLGAVPGGRPGASASTGRRATVPDPATPIPADPAAYLPMLRETFGFPGFRAGQEEVLRALGGGDVLGVMPTGAGKSLCYVLPAMTSGRTVVVSPLIALMLDQVEALEALDIRATFVNSTLPRAEQNARYAAFVRGEYALMFVAPERFRNERFVDGLRAVGVTLLAIDEAHCISEWGHDFRPDYLALGAVRERLGAKRTLALTATADPQVRDDIARRLGMDPGRTIVTSFDRPNLRFAAERVGGEDERLRRVVRYVRERPGRSGIVYARTRRAVEQLTEALRGAGISAVGYHAGMPGGTRATVQRRFVTGEVPVIVATNAFGMGIDKPDVRFVLHAHLPGRLEAYYQEAGRAGRDGDPAECLLLWGGRDRALQLQFIQRAHPRPEEVRGIWRTLVDAQRHAPDRPLSPGDLEIEDADGFAAALTAFRQSGLVEPVAVRLRSLDPDAPIDTAPVERRRRELEARLAQMVEYAETTGCRRGVLLRYFGETPPERCERCDACTGDLVAVEGPTYPDELFADLLLLRDRIAQQAGRAPYTVFEERTAREIATFRPRTPEALLETWGMGETRARWFGAELLDCVRRWEEAHPGADPPPPPPAGPSTSRRGSAPEAGPDVPFDDPHFQRLREWRRARAREEGVPVYTLFTDRTARELAARRPQTTGDLHGIWGLGDSRIERYGADLVALLAAP